MTVQATIDDAARTKRTRRDLLAGAAGALGVVAAQSLGRARPADAGVDGDVVLGVDNQVTGGTTGVQSSAITGLHGRTTATGATGVFGEALSSSGTGVHGVGSVVGVRGDGSSSVNGSSGVVGGSTSLLGSGVFGTATGSFTTGVSGVATGSNSVGVSGFGDDKGVSGTGGPTGVYGDGTVVGVSGHSTNTTGVYGEGGLIGLHGVSLASGATGVGLRVDGRSVFRTAGVATVPSGVKSVTVNLAGVTATDMVLATVQQTGAFYVKNAVAGSGKFTIYLNKAPTSPATVKVAWFVLSAN